MNRERRSLQITEGWGMNTKVFNPMEPGVIFKRDAMLSEKPRERASHLRIVENKGPGGGSLAGAGTTHVAATNVGNGLKDKTHKEGNQGPPNGVSESTELEPMWLRKPSRNNKQSPTALGKK